MEKRIMRLAWNTNWWQYPSGHPWNPKNYKKKDIPFEKGTGYGHEDWLFDPRFQKSNFQYGFIQGVNRLPPTVRHIDQIHLYTKQDDTTNWYYIGYLAGVDIITASSSNFQKIYNWVNNSKKEMEDELRSVGADYMNFRKLGYMPNVFFDRDQDKILSEPILIENTRIKKKLTYYTPIKVDSEIQHFIDGINKTPKFQFAPAPPGKRTITYEITRNIGMKQIANKRHTLLEKELYQFLLNEKNHNEQNISCGKSEIDGKIIDIAVRLQNSRYEIFEIKTEINARLNIRAALGQLFDYGLWLESLKPNKFIVVGESKMNLRTLEYFKRLKEEIKIDIEYWCFNIEELAEKRFKIF